MRFGEYIRNLRLKKDMTLKRASKEIGLSSQRLCDIEKGRRFVSSPPSLDTMKRIAAVYDVAFADLVDNSEFFEREKKLVSELTKAIEPIGKRVEDLCDDMRREARQYTPELEEMAAQATELARDLQKQIRVLKNRFDSPMKAPAGTNPKYSRKRVQNE